MKIFVAHRSLLKGVVSLAAIGCLVLNSAAHAQDDRIGTFLTWSDDPTTTMTINWVNLYEDTPATVFYRSLGESEWQSQSGTHHQVSPSVLQVRRVALENLRPGTDYEFVIGAEPPAEGKQPERFRTMPAKLDRPVRRLHPRCSGTGNSLVIGARRASAAPFPRDASARRAS